MYLLSRFYRQSQRSQCHHWVSEPLRSCFVKHNHSDNSFLLVVCILSFLWVRNPTALRNLRTKFCLKIFGTYYFNDSMDSQNLWGCGSIPANDFFWEFFILQVIYDWETGYYKVSCYGSKSYASIVLTNSDEGEMKAFFLIFLLCFVYRQNCMIEEVCRQIALSSILQVLFHRELQFSSFNSFQFCTKFFHRKLCKFDV